MSTRSTIVTTSHHVSQGTKTGALNSIFNRNTFEHKGWTVLSQTAPISSSADIEQLESTTGIRAPEMCFLDNFYSITNKSSGLSICFNTRGALYGCIISDDKLSMSSSAHSEVANSTYLESSHPFTPVSPTNSTIEDRIFRPVKVNVASLWSSSKTLLHGVLQCNYDWTYTTQYRGHVVHSSRLPRIFDQDTLGKEQQEEIKSSDKLDQVIELDFTVFSPNASYLHKLYLKEEKEENVTANDYNILHQGSSQTNTPTTNLVQKIGETETVSAWQHSSIGINYDRLSQREEILSFSDIMLFEDELHDHGVARANVKARMMDSCFFILHRFFLRVDHVLVRVLDTRFYHEFGSDVVIREIKLQEFSLSSPNTQDLQASEIKPDASSNSTESCIRAEAITSNHSTKELSTKTPPSSVVIPPEHASFYNLATIDAVIPSLPVVFLQNHQLSLREKRK